MTGHNSKHCDHSPLEFLVYFGCRAKKEINCEAGTFILFIICFFLLKISYPFGYNVYINRCMLVYFHSFLRNTTFWNKFLCSCVIHKMALDLFFNICRFGHRFWAQGLQSYLSNRTDLEKQWDKYFCKNYMIRNFKEVSLTTYISFCQIVVNLFSVMMGCCNPW